MKISRLVVKRGKPRVYKRSRTRKWCVGIGKSYTPMHQFKTWKEAFDYAVWWYCNKFIMRLG